ncbi:MAG: phosphatase PAP2 family protein [Lachnospiraceae bacterium]|nr:phosphatase PAP2 family protein [Lachnospiraceae bacterium]
MGAVLMAGWLDKTFYVFDNGILAAMHELGESTGYFANYFFRFISLLADEGIFMIVAALLMALIPLIPAVRAKNPDMAKNVSLCGFAALTAMAIGLIVTNFTIKPNIARLRPYDASELYRSWWELAGGNIDRETSFPSGHTTCTMAIMTSVFIRFNKKYSWTAFILVVLMGLSRNYLMMHYPTDIIGGVIVGGIAAVLANLICKRIAGIKWFHKKEIASFNEKNDV